ncbi:MAG: FkbM family methyltransferase [Chloroflexota bacterium]
MKLKVIKKWLRTWVIHFPFLQDAKSAFTRLYRRALKLPSERDFRALNLFGNLDDALFLDVGANLGQSTDAILMTGRKVWIQLFEPNQFLVIKLRQLFGRMERITIHNFGLGSKSSDAVLYVPFYRNWMFSGHASFDKEEARDGLRNRIHGFDERHVTLREVQSQTRCLDELKLAPFFIKLDTEGYEYQALQGGERTLMVHTPVLLIESANETITEYLKRFGYRPFVYGNGKFHPDSFGSPNTFFITADKLALVPVTALANGKAVPTATTAAQQSRPDPKA